MAGNGHNAARDQAVRMRLRYTDVDTFVARFAPNVSRGGLFLASRQPRPVGDVFRFEVTLADGAVMLAGEGKVTWVKEYDAAQPSKPHGMGVQFVSVDPATRPVLDRILRSKAPRASDGAKPAGSGDADAGARTPAPLPVPVRGAAPGKSNGDAGHAEAPAPRPTPLDPAGADALLAELGVDEAAIRRALDRARTGGARFEDVETLAAPEPPETYTLARAVAELPRLIAGGARSRTRSGIHRTDE